MNRISILGFPIDPLTKPQFLDWVSHIIESNQKQQIITLYSSMLVWSQKDLEFAKIIRNNALNIADGIGLLAAGDYLGQNNFFNVPILFELELLVRGVFIGLRILLGQGFKVIPERLRGVDLIPDLVDLAGQKNWRVYLLGGLGNEAYELRQKFSSQYPGLLIESSIGFPAIEDASPQENQTVIDKINNFSPQILFVALGPVKQEKWISQNLSNLKVNVAMGVGGAFDLLSGRLSRAPKFVQKIGLEWLWRLLTDPKNLLKASAAFPIFPLLVAGEKRKMLK